MYLRHESGSQGDPEPSKEGDCTGDSRCKTAAWSKERTSKSHESEEEAHKIEDPSEAPHVEVVRARGVLSVRAGSISYCLS